MHLLADGVGRGEMVAVVVLCIVAISFVLINVVLLISLHKGNNRLVKRKKASLSEANSAVPEENDKDGG